MKLRNIIFALIAGASIFASCTKEVSRDSLDVLKVDKTFVSIDKLGGEATLTINATADWHIVDKVVEKGKEVSAFPEGLEIGPLAGLKGETKVTFSSPTPRKKAVNCQIEIVCEGQSQFVVFNMEAGAPSPYPDFEAGNYWIMFKQADDTWLASKHCTASIDDAGSYGYVSCQDASGSFPALSSTAENIFTFEAVDGGYVIKDVEGGYIYQDAAGKYNNFYRTSKKAEAMVWTVEQDSETEFYITSSQGKWIQYSTGYSTWGAYNSKQDASLLPYLVAAKDPAPEVLKLEADKVTLEKGAAEFTAKAMINADKVAVDFDADWLSYYGTSEEGFLFKAKANEGGARSAAVKISASLTQDGKEFTGEATLTVEQEGSILAVSVAEFLAAEVGAAQYKLSGFITDRTDLAGHKFDLVNYGNFDLTDASGNAYVYGVGAKGDIATYGVKEGDIIEIIGTRGDYKGTPQVAGGQYVSHKSVTPATAAQVNAMADDDKNDPKNYVRVTGKVTNGTATPGHKFDLETYGNFDLVDESGSLYVYGVSTGWNGETKKFGTLGVKEGDIITLVGYKTSYNGTNELVGMYISHEEGQSEPEFSLAETSWFQYANDADGGFALLSFIDEQKCFFANGDKEGIWWEDAILSTYTYDPRLSAGTAIDGMISFAISADGETLETPMGSFSKAEYVSYEAPVGNNSFETTAPYTKGTNAYDDGVATINGTYENVLVLKTGTSKAAGDINFTIPAGKRGLRLYAVAWKGTEGAKISVKFGGEEVASIEPAANDGATSTSPYTISVATSDQYELDFGEAVAEDTTLNLSSSNRIIYIGVQAF